MHTQKCEEKQEKMNIPSKIKKIYTSVLVYWLQAEQVVVDVLLLSVQFFV